MKKIGLFFGSFSPIHTGHLIIGNSALNIVDEVWFIISPQNPLKKQQDLLNVENRLSLLKASVEDNNAFTVSEIELLLPLPSYTINTLNLLKGQNPKNNFFLILGSDSYKSLSAWKDAEEIQKFSILIYERPGFPINNSELPGNIKKLDYPLLDISSTQIRKMIQESKSIRYLVHDKAFKLIEENKFYSYK